jgi:catecholate siderophore receptor
VSAVKKPVSLRLVSTSALIATTLSSPAYAEEKNTLTPIVVEGTSIGEANPYADPDAPYKVDYSASSKYTEPLLNTPKTIRVVPKEAIKDAGFTSFREVARVEPGVTLGTGEGGNAFGDRVIIRGFEARNDIYIDGLRDPGVVSRETFAVEQMEIIKGPNATFGGRGTTGGAIDIVSKQAVEDEEFNHLEVTFGTDARKRVTLDSNYVVTDRWAVRFNGLLHSSDVAGRDQLFDDRYGAALATTIRPVDQLTLNFDYYHLTTNAMADWGMPFDPATQQPLKVDRDNFYGLVDRDFHDTTANIGTAKAEYDFENGHRLNTTFRYGVTTNAYIASPPERPDFTANTVQASAKTRDQQNQYWANQTNLISEFDTGGVGHTVVSGFEVSRETINNNPFTVTPRAVAQDIYNPDPYNWTGTVAGGSAGSVSHIDNYGLYAMDTIKLSEKWQVSGGLRYDSYQIDVYSPPVIPYRPNAFIAENDSNFWNWHAGVVYKPVPNGSIYFAHSSSSNPSGEQVDGTGDSYGGLSAGNAALDPERNRSYEIGTKWELFDENLALNFAVFQIDKTNARVTGAGGTVALDGEQQVRGFEIGAAGNITDAWSVSSGLAYLDTEITESPNAAEVGADLPNVSDLTFNMQTKYQLTEKLALGGLAYYASEKQGGSVAAGTSTIPSYWRFDLMGEYAVNNQVDLRLNILNVTDQEYYDAIYRSGTPFAYIAPGRAAYLTIGYKF